jgi:glutamate-5-semialdehyde dehydrogenase
MKVKDIAARAKAVAGKVATLSTKEKNEALLLISEQIVVEQQTILDANQLDLRLGRQSGLSDALLDRLALSPDRLMAMVEGIKQVVALQDPVGDVLESWQRPNDLEVLKVRVPMGVVGIIYEGRPNVTVDACALCLKAGSAVVLRGSSSALNSNRALVAAIKRGLQRSALPMDAVQLIDTSDRAAVDEMLRLNGIVDLIIPRGGAGLIKRVIENATVPVIETGVGNCHLYIDKEADPQMAINILVNAKCQRYGVCNTIETLLVHQDMVSTWLPNAIKELTSRGVEIRGCATTTALLDDVKPASETDWDTEYLAPIIAVNVVNSLTDALAHIEKHSSGHSEAIVTNNQQRANIFLKHVDAAAVYHNASTRFTDGFEFGFGAEIGISTQKLHARGPMGLKELTSYKYVVKGKGQTRA